MSDHDHLEGIAHEFFQWLTAEEERQSLVDLLVPVLRHVWTFQPKTKSNFARESANEIAIACSLDWITTSIHGEGWGDIWRITADGLAILEQQE
ncbi:MAG: hypothetical protein KDG54_11185 [Geminicoccaceae bacterium]|nr:hypothetical protein [Geminicoccaceae bacterium]